MKSLALPCIVWFSSTTCVSATEIVVRLHAVTVTVVDQPEGDEMTPEVFTA